MDNDAEDRISDFEHSFAASLEDASKGAVLQPLAGYMLSAGPPNAIRKRSGDAISKPLVGRLVSIHMMETGLVVRETVGVAEQAVASVEYAEIRRLTWDHSQSSVRLGYASHRDLGDGSTQGETLDPDNVFISLRVLNSIELEDELKQRARAETSRALEAGREIPPNPSSVYLGMFAGYTKPKPFERKRPNLSFAVPEGELPSLQVSTIIRSRDNKQVARGRSEQICPATPLAAFHRANHALPAQPVLFERG